MRLTATCLFLLLGLAGTSALAAEPRPGLWKLSVTTMAEGAAQAFGPYSQNQCLTAEDVRDPAKLLAQIGTESCSYSNQKYEGNRFSFDVSCSGELPMSGSGIVDYGSESLSGKVDIVANLQGLEVATSSQVTGQRLSDCQN